MDHYIEQPVTFGDCDPAGIVFYPNNFRWFDRAFHDWLKPFGGHAELCQRLGAVGIGLMEATARFRRPVLDGETLEVQLRVDTWAARSLTLAYQASVSGQLAVEGREVRGLFVRREKKIVAASMGELRALVEKHEQQA